MDSPHTFRLREPTWDDLPAAAEVLAADYLDDAGRVVLDAGFLRGQWERSGFVLTTDAWVAVDGAGRSWATAKSHVTRRTSPDRGGWSTRRTAVGASVPPCSTESRRGR